MRDDLGTFGHWLRRRRRALDLTQAALGRCVACSAEAIRKIEADERRPSLRLAERLARALGVAEGERAAFLTAARAAAALGRLPDAAGAGGTAPGAVLPSMPGAAFPSVLGPLHEAYAFVGRAAEFGRACAAFEAARAGRGGVLLVQAESGLGKSRLLRELCRRVQAQGLPVLAARCYEIERALPFQPLIAWLEAALRPLPAARLAGLAPVAAAEIAALLPELGLRLPGLPALSDEFPLARQARLPGAVAQALDLALAGGAALLVVDDLQWIDDASLQVLQALARHAQQRPWLLLLACRDDEADARVQRLCEAWCAEGQAGRIVLGPLAPEAVAELARSAWPGASQGISQGALQGASPAASPGVAAPDLAARLQRETAGHPLYLTALLLSLAAGELPLEPAGAAAADRPADPPADLPATGAWLPEGLRAAVRRRLAHLPAEVQPVVDAAAVLGCRFDFELLQAVTQLPEAQLLDAIDLLVQRRLLREVGEAGDYELGHDKLREVACQDIGAARRRLLHLQVAQALQQRGDAAVPHGRLAEHWVHAQRWREALVAMVGAGDAARALFALREALHWYDRAVELAEARPEALAPGLSAVRLLELRAAARAQAGQAHGAVADLQQVLAAARAAGDRRAVRDALLQLGMAHRRADAYPEARRCLSEALIESEARGELHQAADLRYHLGTVAWSNGRNAEAIEHHAAAVALCEQAGWQDLVAVQAWHGRGEAHFAHAEPAAALACFERSLGLARRIGDRSYEAENLMMIGHACLGWCGLGDYPRAEALLEQALAIVREADLQWHLAPTELGLAEVWASRGECARAWQAMAATLVELDALQLTRYRFIAVHFRCRLLLGLGLDAAAAQEADAGLALAEATGIAFWRGVIEADAGLAHGRLALRAGEPERCAARLARLAEVAAAARAAAELYLCIPCLQARAELACLAARQGGPQDRAADADAAAAVAELLALAGRGALREVQAVALRWAGALAAGRGEAGAAMQAWTQALQLAEALGRPALRRDLLAELAGLPAAQLAPAQARALARQAAALDAALRTGWADDLGAARPA